MAQLHASKSHALYSAHLRPPGLFMELLRRVVPGGLDWDYRQRATVSFLEMLSQQDEINGPDNSMSPCRRYFFNYQLFLLNFYLSLISDSYCLLFVSCLQHLPDLQTWYKAQAGLTSALIHAAEVYHSSQQYLLLHHRVRSQGTRT